MVHIFSGRKSGVDCGVLQGQGQAGPVLFLIFINDLD